MFRQSGIPHVWNLRSHHRHSLEELYKDENFSREASAFNLSEPSGDYHGESTRTKSTKIIKVPIDGHDVEFSLQRALNEKPQTSRQERKKLNVTTSNAEKSPFPVRCRLYLMKFDVIHITLIYLVLYLTINIMFSLLWSIEDGKCCADPTQTFGQIFDFSIQTATTIGCPHIRISCPATPPPLVDTEDIFQRLVTPYSKIVCSDIITYSNLKGFPCLQIRIANQDCGSNINPLIDIEATLTFEYHIKFKDDDGNDTMFGQTNTLKLTSERRHDLNEGVWTIRHVVDESSPLFGLRFDEAPGNQIVIFRLSVCGTQGISGQRVLKQTSYEIQDIMIGYKFQDQTNYDGVTKTLHCDYGKMNDVVPSPVWYPNLSPSCS